MTRVSAPGKLMLAGEYAVLEGHGAVVAALDRRVVCGDGVQGLDDSALLLNGIKLGLGSSSAKVVASAAWDVARTGGDVVAERGAIHRAAHREHQRIAPQGSGVDVAASVYGGILHVRPGGALPTVTSLRAPVVTVRVVWTGEAVRTSDMLHALSTFAERKAHLDGLGVLSDAFFHAWQAGDPKRVVDAAGQYGDAMGRLGTAAGMRIVTPALAMLAEVARQCGGAAKPSGAGGGDVGVGFFFEPAQADAFDRLCAGAGLTPISLKLGAEGVQSGL